MKLWGPLVEYLAEVGQILNSGLTQDTWIKDFCLVAVFRETLWWTVPLIAPLKKQKPSTENLTANHTEKSTHGGSQWGVLINVSNAEVLCNREQVKLEFQHKFKTLTLFSRFITVIYTDSKINAFCLQLIYWLINAEVENNSSLFPFSSVICRPLSSLTGRQERRGKTRRSQRWGPAEKPQPPGDSSRSPLGREEKSRIRRSEARSWANTLHAAAWLDFWR